MDLTQCPPFVEKPLLHGLLNGSIPVAAPYILLAELINGLGMVMAIVLVVDDEVLIRMNAADLVEEAGVTALEAANADEAIQTLVTRSDIYAVFSDVQMPGTMDGVRLLQVIRDRWPPVRLVLTSGKSLPEDADLPNGSVFVPKPYGIEEVRAALLQ